MTSTPPILRLFLVSFAFAVAFLSVACNADSSSPVPSGVPPGTVQATEVPATGEIPTSRAQQPRASAPPARTVAPRSSLIPTLAPSEPQPTPHPSNTEWVRLRLNAVIALYRPTLSGEALLHSLDVRQMQGEPGFFGSYGFESWAGVGEAKPIPLMHELGHSYWGAFQVIGNPNLRWQRQGDEEIPPALSAYHRDIIAFMAQPPDEFEILRQRLRNLPGLSATNTEPVFHSLEADVPYTTGGDLSLVPPVLRKYWGHFLTDGPFGTWEQAAGWLQSLSHEERFVAGKFLGFEHLDLRLFRDTPPYTPPGALLATAAETLAVEERQRLTDFAEQFDLLIGDPQLEENFQFWRGYLQDKAALNRSHPEHLSSLPLPRASELSEALAFLGTLEGSPEDRATALQGLITAQPFLVNLLPAVDDPTLVSLFADNPELPDAPTLHATASFVNRLRRFGRLVESVHAAGRSSPDMGTAALKEFLSATDLEQEHDIKLFFDLFYSTEPSLSRQIVAAMDGGTVQALMVPVPVQLRAILDPGTLLRKLDITVDSSMGDLTQGLMLLLDETSGNYRIDEPFLELLYQVIAAREENDPDGTARVIGNPGFPLAGFILSQPAAVSRIMSKDIDVALNLVQGSDPVLSPPPRIIYRLIKADPSLAALLVDSLSQRGEGELVTESLAYFAYDKARSEKFPRLPISLEQDGTFLKHLIDRKGADWLEDRLREAVAAYRSRAEAGEVSPHFLAHYRQTVDSAAALAPGHSRILTEVISRAFGAS